MVDDKPTFTKGQKLWALVDGKRISAFYDYDAGDGFHFVRLARIGSDHVPIYYRLTASEITERYI